MCRFAATTLSALITVCATAALTVPAAAAETETSTAKVSTAGLNLNTAAGAAILRQRVEGAARAVCGAADSRDMRAMADLRTCRAVALEGADLQMRAALAEARLAAARHTEVSDSRH
jgi:UrcA family protein